MAAVVQTQPSRHPATERTALLLHPSRSTSSASSTSTLHSVSSFSELNVVAPITACRISRHKNHFCCDFIRTRKFHVNDYSRGRTGLLLRATQENGCCSSDYEDVLVYDSQEQLMFSIEFEEATGYLSTQMKFSIVSSAHISLGTVSRVWSFMESPKFEILNWDNEHLFVIGAPTTSGIKSYDFKTKYEVISNDGRAVATLAQDAEGISLNFDVAESLQHREKTLILALGFILDLLRNEET